MKNQIITFFLLYYSIVFAQDISIKALPIVIDTTNIASFKGSDKLGNSYYLKNNILTKIQGATTFEYKNIALGKLSRIDFENPLKIVVFYESFNTVVTLDNQLNESEKINFSENTTPIVASATGMASQNQLWIYNSLTQQIGLYAILQNKFTPLTQSFRGNVKNYFSNFNYFYWLDDQNNWRSCDVFGKITNYGKVADFDSLEIIDAQFVLYSKDNSLYLHDFKSKKIYVIENVKKSFNRFSFKDQILTIFTNQEITNYKIKIP
jgi:hypothetical protein